MKKFIVTLVQIAVITIWFAGCMPENNDNSPVEPVTSTENVEPSGGILPTDVIEEDPIATSEELDISQPSATFAQNYGPNEISDRDYSELEIVTLLPQDAIPALTYPDYYTVEEANQEYFPDELVIGVEFNGDARAYAVSLLSTHEIVNESVGGIHLAVTW